MPLIGISHSSGVFRKGYILHALAENWRSRGIEVEIGSDFPPGADLAILHHDRTRLNPADLPPSPDGLRVLNRDVLDISKRLYSELMLADGDDWGGPVIVKSNLNHFGVPERHGARRNRLREAQNLLAGYNWKLARCLPHKVYPVLASISDVPGWVWRREDLLVERFLPEREGDLFAMRGWIFLGSASYSYRVVSTHPMVKSGNKVSHEYLDEAPPELEAARQRMGFDYGKFDYVVHDGRAILLDANKTPTYSGGPLSDRLKRLADAATEFLP